MEDEDEDKDKDKAAQEKVLCRTGCVFTAPTPRAWVINNCQVHSDWFMKLTQRDSATPLSSHLNTGSWKSSENHSKGQEQGKENKNINNNSANSAVPLS